MPCLFHLPAMIGERKGEKGEEEGGGKKKGEKMESSAVVDEELMGVWFGLVLTGHPQARFG